MRILNLYAGIGGNRKLWGDNHEITSVEYNDEIATIYADNFPGDTLIVGDAHAYLLDNYKEFDFIWSSPPCQSHSDMRRMMVKKGQNKALYIDAKLWEEIIFLKHHFEGKYVVENVIPYYEPFVKPSVEINRHLFWANFQIRATTLTKSWEDIRNVSSNTIHFGFDISKYKIKHRKDQILRNCVNPELGLYILEQACGVIREAQNKQLSFL